MEQTKCYICNKVSDGKLYECLYGHRVRDKNEFERITMHDVKGQAQASYLCTTTWEIYGKLSEFICNGCYSKHTSKATLRALLILPLIFLLLYNFPFELLHTIEIKYNLLLAIFFAILIGIFSLILIGAGLYFLYCAIISVFSKKKGGASLLFSVDKENLYKKHGKTKKSEEYFPPINKPKLEKDFPEVRNYYNTDMFYASMDWLEGKIKISGEAGQIKGIYESKPQRVGKSFHYRN